jgi:O-antigen/teichoic acid export membrane protein
MAAILQPATLVVGLATFGFPSAVVYFIGRGNPAGAVLRVALRQLIIPTLGIFGMLLVYGWLIARGTGISFVFIATVWLTVPVAALLAVTRGYWQGVGEWRRLDFERAAGPVIRLVGIAGLALLAVRDARHYVVASAAASVLALIPLVLPFIGGKRPGGDSPAGNQSVSARSLWNYALAAWPTTALLYAGARLDQALMPLASSSRELGLYTVSVTFAEIPTVGSALIAREALHMVSRGSGFAETARALWLYWVALIAGSLVIALSAGWLVPTLTSQEFAAAVAPLRVLTLATVFTGIILFVVAYLEGSGRPWLGFIGPAITVVGTAVAFVAQWGDISALDAAWIAVLTQLVAVLVCIGIVMAPKTSKRGGSD